MERIKAVPQGNPLLLLLCLPRSRLLRLVSSTTPLSRLPLGVGSGGRTRLRTSRLIRVCCRRRCLSRSGPRLRLRSRAAAWTGFGQVTNLSADKALVRQPRILHSLSEEAFSYLRK